MVGSHRSVRAVKSMNCLRRLKRWGRVVSCRQSNERDTIGLLQSADICQTVVRAVLFRQRGKRKYMIIMRDRSLLTELSS